MKSWVVIYLADYYFVSDKIQNMTKIETVPNAR